MFLRIAQKIPGIHLYEYLVVENVCYVVNPKAASSSLRKAFARYASAAFKNKDLSYSDITYFGSMEKIKKVSIDRYIFTVIREPERRIYSCWEQKVNRRDSSGYRFLNQYFLFYYPAIRFGQSFDNFISAVSWIPDFLSEKHFMSQSNAVGVDYIRYSKIYVLEDIDLLSNDMKSMLPSFSIGNPENVTGSSVIGVSLNSKEVIQQRYRPDFDLYNSIKNSRFSDNQPLAKL